MNQRTVARIKSVLSTVNHENAILFGSRAKGTAKAGSDYDILLIMKRRIDHVEKMRISSFLRRELAKIGIDADILIKSKTEIEYYKDKIGNVTRAALEEGIAI
jgi:uncharacterized protein